MVAMNRIIISLSSIAGVFAVAEDGETASILTPIHFSSEGIQIPTLVFTRTTASSDSSEASVQKPTSSSTTSLLPTSTSSEHSTSTSSEHSTSASSEHGSSSGHLSQTSVSTSSASPDVLAGAVLVAKILLVSILTILATSA
ncbi:hypothetical protein GGI26_001825 [Coemansia sp. RSA 1358]|uniref:REJ domain-containing protein n=1 Tax=Coemansia umbellata TaxID=1424467 RepID=A0ABQ8PSR8_9FUNG|nr:hypothetical protein EDC05_001195 [Coemansia umbellata]KAJ2624032.1 hypothetical protein GGI26_001825 [Coemansia sp. RSA 1358]